MGKLYYYYGTMNSSKTANLLMVAYNYTSQGRRIFCLKSNLDTRNLKGHIEEESTKGYIESRAIEKPLECELVSKDEDIFELIKRENKKTLLKYSTNLSAILVDEAQFLTKEQVRQLSLVVEDLKIDVLCFGLKNTFIDGELFEGSSALFYYANSIKEIKTICKYCNKKATMNLRVIDGRAIYDSENSVAVGDVVGGKETYAQVCYEHYLNPPAPIIGKKSKKYKRNFVEQFNYILTTQNKYGYIRKTSEVAKLGLSFANVYPISCGKDIEKIKYISFGPICVNLEEFSKYEFESKVNTFCLTECVIKMIYAFFENDPDTAFNMLKKSSCRYIEFYEDDEEYKNSLVNRKSENSKKYYYDLPDGRKYYMDGHASRSMQFYQSVFGGFSKKLNNLENIGMFFEE